MKTEIAHQKTVSTKHCVRYINKFPIDLPLEKIDLYKWVTEMTDADYRSYSKSHLAMGSFYRDNTFYTLNVENIGNEQLVQHYELKYHSPYHVQFYSPDTIAFILRWFPAVVGVPWELQVRAISKDKSELVCLIGADFSSGFLKTAAWFNGLGGFFLNRHLRTEGKAFAKDIERKFK
ncbi:MAG: hypothetical protein WDO14_20070 [Bacteroidota bacterium]